MIQDLLKDHDRVVAVLSPAEKNVDPNLRRLMFRNLLRKLGVDVSRVDLPSESSTKVLERLVEEHGAEHVTIGLGQDRENVAKGVAKKYGIRSRVIDRPEGAPSSTMMRGLIDSGDEEGLGKQYMNDSYLMRLAKQARENEKGR